MKIKMYLIYFRKQCIRDAIEEKNDLGLFLRKDKNTQNIRYKYENVN